MKTKFLTLLSLVLVLFSCKQETKQTDVQPITETISNDFIVTLDVKVSKDDSFHLYYTEDGSINFNEEFSVWDEFKGSPENQLITFKLPENVFPTQIRLDFGLNKQQENITINSFKMDYKGKTFEAKGAQFFTYFQPNLKTTNVERGMGLIIPVKNEGAYVGPSFYPLPSLEKELALLAK